MAGEKHERSAQFRFVFSNSFSMKIADNDMTISFGNEQQLDWLEKTIFDEVAVCMTPRSMKVLSHLLKTAIDNFEAVAGPIPVQPGKLEEITTSLSEMRKATQTRIAEKKT